jgi:putative membrane protein
MTSARAGFVAAAVAAMGVGVAWAESEAEYKISQEPRTQLAPPVVAAPAAASPLGAQGSQPFAESPRPAPRQADRPILFAPTAAATARPLTAAQREEWRFLKDAAAASRFEADASRVALKRSTDPAVRSLAGALVQHHTAATDELVVMLHMRGMAPPMLSTEQRKILNRLGKLSGPAFDRVYVDDVALRHQHGDVQLFEKASAAAQDPRLKGWIDRSLPAMRNQLASAEAIAQPKQVQPAPASAPAQEQAQAQGATVKTAARTGRAGVTRASLSANARRPLSEWNDSEPAPALDSIRVGASAPEIR